MKCRIFDKLKKRKVVRYGPAAVMVADEADGAITPRQCHRNEGGIMKLGMRIRKARERMKMSVMDLATHKRVKVHPQTIYDWESGVQKPKKLTLVGLSQILECDLFESGE